VILPTPFPDGLEELKEKLEPAEPGLFKLKNSSSKTRFILTTEVSCVYFKKGKQRKIHLIIFSPSIEACEKINNHLKLYGDLEIRRKANFEFGCQGFAENCSECF